MFQTSALTGAANEPDCCLKTTKASIDGPSRSRAHNEGNALTNAAAMRANVATLRTP